MKGLPLFQKKITILFFSNRVKHFSFWMVYYCIWDNRGKEVIFRNNYEWESTNRKFKSDLTHIHDVSSRSGQQSSLDFFSWLRFQNFLRQSNFAAMSILKYTFALQLQCIVTLPCTFSISSWTISVVWFIYIRNFCSYWMVYLLFSLSCCVSTIVIIILARVS